MGKISIDNMDNDKTQNAETKAVVMRKLDLLLRTGQILMESSADTSRVMRNMKRAAAYMGFHEENLHIYADYYVLQVNLSDEAHSFSKMQRCDKHVINFYALQEISKLTWRAIKEDYSLDQYADELERIAHGPQFYTSWVIAICAGFACGGFCVQFGCDWTAFFYASIAAILGNRLRMWMNKMGSNVYFNIACATFVSTIIAWLTTFLSTPAVASALPQWLASVLHSDTPYHPIMACALYIVPGVPLINFVDDMLDNHIETGLVRATNTLLMIGAMAFGIAAAIEVCGVDNFVKDLSMTPHNSFVSYAIAAAISGFGFATIYDTPRRLMPWIAIGAIIAVCTRNFVNLGPDSGNVGLGLGLMVGSLVGSALISVINIKMVHVVHTPHQVITIPSVIPMIPGVLMYRALYGLIDMQGIVGEVTFATHNAINGLLVILVIAVGVAIPNIFFRKWIAPERRAKLERLIAERKARGKFVQLCDVE